MQKAILQPHLSYYPGTCLEGLRKTVKWFYQNSQKLTPGYPEYDAGIPKTPPRCPVV
jgi:hypothetical protein